MSITGLLSIFLAAILTNNYILSKFLGISSVHYLSIIFFWIQQSA